MDQVIMRIKIQGQEQFNLYRFQKRVLPVLLGWSAGSIVAGSFWLSSSRLRLQGFGSQFLGWGLIDGLIAIFGLKAAKNNADKFDRGEVNSTELQRQTKDFERILWVNIFLDFSYILFGSWITDRARNAERQRGIGLGIIFQGTFLLIWDLLLLLFMKANQNVR